VTDTLDPFDIFKMEQNGTVNWVRATSNFERAKSYVNEVLAVATPGDCLILNQRTCERIIIPAATEEQDSRLNLHAVLFSSAAVQQR
jgi:hypothetical protein